MNLTRCNNGHFYDADKFSACPHCNLSGKSVDDGVTVSVNSQHDMVTEKFEVEDLNKTVSLSDAVGIASSINRSSMDADDIKTISFYKEQTGREPIVGWLVVVSGEHLGEGFSLKSGRNFVGRSHTMDVVLDGDSGVSRERHAIIIYEPKNRIFYAQPGEARELFYVNGEVILSNVELHIGDTFLIGNTELKFVPFCTKDFAWEDIKKEV